MKRKCIDIEWKQSKGKVSHTVYVHVSDTCHRVEKVKVQSVIGKHISVTAGNKKENDQLFYYSNHVEHFLFISSLKL